MGRFAASSLHFVSSSPAVPAATRTDTRGPMVYHPATREMKECCQNLYMVLAVRDVSVGMLRVVYTKPNTDERLCSAPEHTISRGTPYLTMLISQMRSLLPIQLLAS
jgi:hypothetical protein